MAIEEEIALMWMKRHKHRSTTRALKVLKEYFDTYEQSPLLEHPEKLRELEYFFDKIISKRFAEALISDYEFIRSRAIFLKNRDSL